MPSRAVALLSALLCVAFGAAFAALAHTHTPTAAAVEEGLLVAAHVEAPQAPLDWSPVQLSARTKTSGCSARGPYPDPACTPGAIFASTTLEALCAPGYTQKVRNVSTTLKRRVYAEYGVAYPEPGGTYEADHLIPLELGGSNDIANLFPEAASPAPGFREKDLVENYLHQEVCAARAALPRAQEEIAHDWVAVYESLTQDQLAELKAEFRNWSNPN
ncbi:MAG: HNH endonuclease [Patescibacteria group bacterium]|nr:HNH endonuclease [Patescibacteria group bacterium]